VDSLESECHIVYAEELKKPVRETSGREVVEFTMKTLKEILARFVQVQANKGDCWPQIYELRLIGDACGRILNLLETFLETATSRLMNPTAAVLSAV
jgi:hypothetical protein